MFDITIDGQQLYHPNSVECNVSQAVIHEALNDAGYMEITLPFSNPMYDSITERKSKITVYKDNVELWNGEVRSISVDFSKNKTLYVVGEAAYLNDSVQPLKEYKDMTKFQVFEEMLNIHNAMAEPFKQFQPGTIGHNAQSRKKIVTNWEYTLDAIRKYLCEDEEYIRIRTLNGVRYIDIMPLETYGKKSEQDILFADNLLDYLEEIEGENIASACIPLGQTLDNAIVEGYDNYLTCEAANNGKNYVYIPGAVDRIGFVTKVVHFNVLNTPDALVNAGLNWLKEKQYADVTLKLSAVDLSILHTDIDNYAVGDYVRAICEPMGMDAYFPVRERETDLIDIANNKITIGASRSKTITEKQSEDVADIEKIIPSRNEILLSALKNASALINSNGEGGYVSIRTDSDGKPYEIVVMDAPSLKESERAWRWNLSGFGHGTKTKGTDIDFTWESNIALTMDGEIIATKGTISGFTINMNKTLDGVLTDFLQAVTPQKGSFIIGHKPSSGKSVLKMEHIDNGVTKIVGGYDDYLYVGQIDKNGVEKGTKIEPECITTDGKVIAYGRVYCNGNYDLYSGVTAAANNASTALSAANTAISAANSADSKATSAGNLANSANAQAQYNKNSIGDLAKAIAQNRIDIGNLSSAVTTLASSYSSLVSTDQALYKLIKTYHP